MKDGRNRKFQLDEPCNSPYTKTLQGQKYPERRTNTVMEMVESFLTQQAMGTQVALLHRISSIVSSGLELETMLRELVDLIMQVSDSDACLVYLVDHATNEIVLRASQLPHSGEIGNIRLQMGEGITGWVAKHKSVVALAKDASLDTRFKGFTSLQEDTYEAFLSVPLVSGGDLIGVINVHHREPHKHTSDEVALVSFIGEQMGGALAKSRLAEQSQGAFRRMEALAAVAQTIAAESYLDRISCKLFLKWWRKLSIPLSARSCWWTMSGGNW